MQEDFSMLDLMSESGESSGLILQLIKRNGMTADELIKEFDLSPDDVKARMDALIAKGLVREVQEKGTALYRAVIRRKPETRKSRGGGSPLDNLFSTDE